MSNETQPATEVVEPNHIPGSIGKVTFVLTITGADGTSREVPCESVVTQEQLSQLQEAGLVGDVP